jgi:hypothetical protein
MLTRRPQSVTSRSSGASAAPTRPPSPTESNSDSEPNPKTSRPRAVRNSRRPPTQENARPNQLRFYKETRIWFKALTRSKSLFNVFIFAQCGFPSGTMAYHEAKDSIKEAVEFFREQGDEVEPGTMIIPVLYTSISHLNLDHDLNDSMIKLVCGHSLVEQPTNRGIHRLRTMPRASAARSKNMFKLARLPGTPFTRTTRRKIQRQIRSIRRRRE